MITVQARIPQGLSVIEVLLSSYIVSSNIREDRLMQHTLPAEVMFDALSAARELLQQAKDAADQIAAPAPPPAHEVKRKGPAIADV